MKLCDLESECKIFIQIFAKLLSEYYYLDDY